MRWDSKDARRALFGLHGLVSGAVDKGTTPATCLFRGLGLQGAFFFWGGGGVLFAGSRVLRAHDLGFQGFVSGLGL